MGKRTSEEARVTGYFASAPLETAQAVLNIVKDIVKNRTKTVKVEPPAFVAGSMIGPGDVKE